MYISMFMTNKPEEIVVFIFFFDCSGTCKSIKAFVLLTCNDTGIPLRFTYFKGEEGLSSDQIQATLFLYVDITRESSINTTLFTLNSKVPKSASAFGVLDGAVEVVECFFGSGLVKVVISDPVFASKIRTSPCCVPIATYSFVKQSAVNISSPIVFLYLIVPSIVLYNIKLLCCVIAMADDDIAVNVIVCILSTLSEIMSSPVSK
mmetsp:Transcript_26108/g.29047  ORF Transcript_26108/g.29047 Transcript_26108/m.29047 type:complete len:205 (+) Transcript_26108:292-906(+)